MAPLLKNAQGTSVYALSVPDVTPSRQMIWYHAQTRYWASDKRLPTDEKWLCTAQVAVDPGSNAALGNRKCNTTG
ncbi:MAG TPA: hypothetical protein PLJ27_05100 [Polyangiaceae bacterium]|jgi:hypothetical protein|nr:MAG: hypothetical protein BWY17_04430 [Deltaproteobacteria bacterium ADurb.Bin207]HNS97932.1 hypothetical protein [Polyangiaceae bacterium]HNZ23531.1 hypothetical protein [Polyangiaceae bacterium]HOD24744.1 hypothetical protein [Polyangiaceae bacterium]HOE50747.1 hypothetical protein [Polyangiaceae bacterium]